MSHLPFLKPSCSLCFSVAPGRPAQRQKRSSEDDGWSAASSSSPYRHLPLRPSKSLNYSRNRYNRNSIVIKTN